MSNSTKTNNKKSKQSSTPKTQDDEYKQLLRRLAYLEAENDCLKKLAALIRQKEHQHNQ